jgi:hypothetical protein
MQGHVVSQYSQAHKVKEALSNAGVSHNAGLVAHLSNVRVGLDGVVYL